MSESNGQVRRITSGSQVRQVAAKLKWEDVPVPEWAEDDGVVPVLRLRELTGDERDTFDTAVAKARKGKGPKAEVDFRGMRARMIVMAAVDEDGNRVFSDDDLGWLRKSGGAAVSRLWAVGAKLSGLTAEEVDEAEEGLAPAQPEPSLSG